MKATKITLAVLGTFAALSSQYLQAQESHPHYVQEMNSMANKIEARLAQLREIAQHPDYVLEKNGKRYLSLNEIEYEINEFGNIELPLMHWSDTSAIRNLFTFFDENWELSTFMGGAVFVNLNYGNYDYGNGCLLEYYPTKLFDSNNVLRETYSCQAREQQPNQDEADYLNPFDFGLSAQSDQLVAIDKENALLAVINSAQNNAAVGIRNSATGHSKRISGINATPYQSLSDVRFFDGKLYVVANKEARIDVFTPDTAEHLYSLTLNDFAKGSAKIAINEQFIMLTADNAIHVYPNTASNNAKTVSVSPFAYFAYGSDSKPHSLEIVKDELIAVSNETTSIYAIADLKQNQRVDARVSQAKGFEAFDINADQLIVKDKQRVAFYDLATWLKSNYQFDEASKALYLVDDYVINSNDLLVEADHFYNINDASIQRVHSPAVVSFDSNDSVATTSLSYASLPQQAISPVFHDAMTEADFHALSANTASLVNVRLVDNKTVEIANFTEFDLEGLQLDLKTLGQHDYARLSTLDKLPAYTKIRLPLSYFNSKLKFNSASGKGTYDYSKLLADLRASKFGGSLSVNELFRSRFDTTTSNIQLEKIKQITADWNISFRNHTFTNELEKAWTAEKAKQWIKHLTNMAYVISSKEFADRWLNFKDHYGYEMQHVPGYVGEFTQKTYEAYLTSMQTNAFTLLRKNKGLQFKTGIRGEVGTLFGMSDAEFDKVLNGDLMTFATYLGDQINRNFVLDCLPDPCDKDFDYFESKDKGFAPMLLDVVEILETNGGLIH